MTPATPRPVLAAHANVASSEVLRVFTCGYACVRVCKYAFVWEYVCMDVCIMHVLRMYYVCMMHECMYECMYMYVCMYVSMHIYVCMYKYVYAEDVEKAQEEKTILARFNQYKHTDIQPLQHRHTLHTHRWKHACKHTLAVKHSSIHTHILSLSHTHTHTNTHTRCGCPIRHWPYNGS